MKKFRFLFLVLALILVVGMTTGVIVRKQSGSQTVLQHSGASAPASTTPATTGDDEPAAPEPQVFKISVLIREDISQYFTVIENGVEVDPIDVFEYALPSHDAESKGGDPGETYYYSETFARYLVDPTCSSIEHDHNLRPSDPWFTMSFFECDFTDTDVIVYNDAQINSSSGTIDLRGYLFLLIN